MRSEDIKYVIIQAGGKGIRMGRYAENKPKSVSYTHLTLPTNREV